jgi:hypothetical protein
LKFRILQCVVVIALAVGFPIAMLLSWVYEFTPEGVVLTADRPPLIGLPWLGISRLRKQAAAVGANGIFLQRVCEVAAGGLAIDAGGFGYSGHCF